MSTTKMDLAEAMFLTEYSSEDDESYYLEEYEEDSDYDEEEEEEGEEYEDEDSDFAVEESPPHICACCRQRRQSYRHEIRRDFRKARREKKLAVLAEKKREEEDERKRKRKETRLTRSRDKKSGSVDRRPCIRQPKDESDPLAETRRHLESEAKERKQLCLERNAIVEAMLQLTRKKESLRRLAASDVFSEGTVETPTPQTYALVEATHVKVLQLHGGQEQNLFLVHNGKVRLWAGVAPHLPNREMFERILRNSRRVLSNRVAGGTKSNRTSAKSGIKKLYVAKERKLYEITSVNKDQRPIASLRGVRNLASSSSCSAYFMSLIPHLKRQLTAPNDCILLFEECVTRHNLINKRAHFV